jgi:hypothetical protein
MRKSCEKVAKKIFKAWIEAVKQTIATECEIDVSIFLPPVLPSGLARKLNIFKNIALILSNSSCQLSMCLTTF